MLRFKNNTCVRKYFFKALASNTEHNNIGVFLLAKACQLLSAGDGEGEWELWEQTEGQKPTEIFPRR